MKIAFRTNIDAYNLGKDLFPENFTQVPRKGDMIQVKFDYVAHMRNLKLPIRLEVVNVTWTKHPDGEEMIFVELWYNDTDFQISKNSGGKPL